MTRNYPTIFALGICLLPVPQALPQSYHFDSYANQSELSSSGWSTTDTNAPGSRNEAVDYNAQGSLRLIYNSDDTNNQVGILGGYFQNLPPSGTTTLLTAPVTAVASPYLRFRWTQNIQNASSDDGIRDRFGWTIRTTDSSNNPYNLVSLMLDPMSTTGTFAAKNTLLTRAVAGGPGGASLGSTVLEIQRGSTYSFEIILNTIANTWSAAATGTADYENSANLWTTLINQAPLSLVSGQTVSGFSAAWVTHDQNPADGISYGSNIMAFDNIQIDSVPEPSSLSLFALGSLAVLAARRRSS